jgi:hypothetical protein
VWPRNEAASYSTERSRTTRSIFVAIIILSASMAVAHPAQAQQHSQRSPSYGYAQTPMDSKQSAHDDLKSIVRDNRDLELPASQDDIVGAGQVHSEEEVQTKRIDQDSERIDREIRNICPSC